MVSRADERLTVNVGGRERRLISLYERKNGDVVVKIHSAQNFRNLDDQATGPGIQEQRYSIHLSLLSADAISTIKHTLILVDGTKMETYHPTRALRRRAGYALMFVKRCSDFQSPRYDLGEKSSRSIGALDVETHSLYYGVFTCRKPVSFPKIVSPCVNITIFQFRELMVIVLWSFCAFPAAPTTQMEHAMVPQRREYGKAVQTLPTISSCLTLFMKTAERMAIQNVDEIDQPNGEVRDFFRQRLIFFSKGWFSEEEWGPYRQRMLMKTSSQNHWYWPIIR